MTDHSRAPYQLYYWPTIQGRGEFVRLAFEAAGRAYDDVAREPASAGGGTAAIARLLRGEGSAFAPFAPPFLKVGDLLVAQTSAILAYLGPRLGLVPEGEDGRSHALQLQLTIADFVAEVHDTHHPVASSLVYEDQKPEAVRRAKAFVAERVPKFMSYFEKRLASSGAGAHLIGTRLSYPDLSLFQVVAGLRYAFPRAFAALEPSLPHVVRLHDRVAALPNVAAYLKSERRLPFNQDGIFRHYPELDARALGTGHPR